MATETIHLNLTMNQHGQITLPKSLRKLMGLEKGSGLKLVASPTKATIERAETIEEVLADLDTKKSPKVRAKIKQLSNKTVADLRDEYISLAEFDINIPTPGQKPKALTGSNIMQLDAVSLTNGVGFSGDSLRVVTDVSTIKDNTSSNDAVIYSIWLLIGVILIK